MPVTTSADFTFSIVDNAFKICGISGGFASIKT
jgi:hypothetical protein